MSENNSTFVPSTSANSDALAPMKCRQVIDLLGDLVENDLSKGLRDTVESHLATCPECSAAWASYKQVIEVAGELAIEDEARPLDVGVQNRLRKALNQRLGLSLPFIA
jgi:anti-sigma factor RsiW